MKKIYLVLFVILSIFVFSCKDNLISDDLSSSQNSGAGQVKVFVKQSRLIGPDVSEVTWNVKLQKSGENNTISGKNENGYYLFSGLSDGTYNITVYGKIDEVVKFTGSAKVTITNGNSVSVNVPIVAKKGTDNVGATGYATITMDMSEELINEINSFGNDVKFSVFLSSCINQGPYYNANLYQTNDETDFPTILNKTKVYFYDSEGSSKDISVGYYNLLIWINDKSLKLKDNLVEIGDGLTTNIVLTQDDYELVYNSEYTYYVNNTGDENNTGLTLSSPIAYTSLPEDIGVVFLLEDVEGPSTSLNNYYLISSFGSKIFTITNPVSDGTSFSPSLKNIKIAGNYSINLNSSIYDTVILDIPVVSSENGDSCVYVSKSSNLRIGQKFSGELGICLSSGNWQLGDTVVTFENGKPNNANFYISESYDSQGNSLASKFYIDDNGKLAQYDASTQWVNFAWNGKCPYLITQTQAKNKTYTSIYDSNDGYLYGFNGISTYDGNRTWYFIANISDANGNTVYSLYKVSAPTGYTDSVTPEKIEVDGNLFKDVQAMDYDDGKLYFGYYINGGYSFYSYDVSNQILTTIETWLLIQMTNANSSDLTSFMVKGNDFYFATTFTTTQPAQGVTHSAIWKYTLSEDTSDNGYLLIPAESYVSEVGECPVPYYMTSSDDELKVGESFPENSTFRITDLYSDGNSVYGLLANYEDKVTLQNAHSDIHMRGSVFKLTTNSSRQENSEPMMNANHFELRNSFPLTTSELPTAKHFILPRKIVGIVNKKLVIVDDGMVPDSNDCNVDRFVFFDLAGEISETIDVGTSFTTQASVSSNKFYTFDPLFDAQQY